MVVVLSRMIAFIITVMLACVLYPIAAVFYVVGLFGKMGSGLFNITNKMIKYLWNDLKHESGLDIESNNAVRVEEIETKE